jgi:hypothetical protein
VKKLAETRTLFFHHDRYKNLVPVLKTDCLKELSILRHCFLLFSKGRMPVSSAIAGSKFIMEVLRKAWGGGMRRLEFSLVAACFHNTGKD